MRRCHEVDVCLSNNLSLYQSRDKSSKMPFAIVAKGEFEFDAPGSLGAMTLRLSQSGGRISWTVEAERAPPNSSSERKIRPLVRRLVEEFAGDLTTRAAKDERYVSQLANSTLQRLDEGAKHIEEASDDVVQSMVCELAAVGQQEQISHLSPAVKWQLQLRSDLRGCLVDDKALNRNARHRRFLRVAFMALLYQRTRNLLGSGVLALLSCDDLILSIGTTLADLVYQVVIRLRCHRR